MLYNMLYRMLYNMVWICIWAFCQRWIRRHLDCSVLTTSERIIQDFASKKKVDATFIRDLIQNVLHHPDFDPDDVNHDMHERQMTAIEEGDLEVIDLKKDGDGNQGRQGI